MKDSNRYTKDRLHDHPINCDLCGTSCWYSETRTLTKETGEAGAIVCRRHKDPIDYGLVPYKIPAEKGVKETRVLSNFNDNTNIDGVTPFNLDTQNPLSSN